MHNFAIKHCCICHINSAGASLNEAPPNYNNWPSILWRPYFSCHLTEQHRTTTVIHLHAPRKFFP